MGLTVLAIFVLCAIYAQNRGKVKHKKLVRKISDHSNLLGPINCLFYGFSTFKKSAYIDADKQNNRNYYEKVLPVLRGNGLVIIDNVLWKGKVVKGECQDEKTRSILVSPVTSV